MRRVHGIVGVGLVALVASAGFAGQAQRASAPAVAQRGSVDTLGRAVLPGTQALFVALNQAMAAGSSAPKWTSLT